MENIAVQLLVAICLMAFTAIVTFFTTKHNLREYTNEKFNELKDKLHNLELEVEKIKGRDENQQQIIHTLQRQVLDQIPEMMKALNNTKKAKK